jgi:L-threonylcarbamoyladenylate synthase
MKYRHYAPKARVTLVHGGLPAFADYLAHHPQPDTWAMAFDEDIPALSRVGIPNLPYGGEGDAASQANRLFAALRELDEKGAARVYARAPKPEGMGLAVYNRLLRAASFEELHLKGGGCGCGGC